MDPRDKSESRWPCSIVAGRSWFMGVTGPGSAGCNMARARSGGPVTFSDGEARSPGEAGLPCGETGVHKEWVRCTKRGETGKSEPPTGEVML
jgi:hypothetical protein